MGLWSKEQLRAFIKEKNLVTAQDAQNALNELQTAVTAIARKNVVSEYGEQELAVPRRDGRPAT